MMEKNFGIAVLLATAFVAVVLGAGESAKGTGNTGVSVL